MELRENLHLKLKQVLFENIMFSCFTSNTGVWGRTECNLLSKPESEGVFNQDQGSIWGFFSKFALTAKTFSNLSWFSEKYFPIIILHVPNT